MPSLPRILSGSGHSQAGGRNSPHAITGKDGAKEGLAAVLHPHRRVRIMDIVTPASCLAAAPAERVEELKAGEELLPTRLLLLPKNRVSFRSRLRSRMTSTPPWSTLRNY